MAQRPGRPDAAATDETVHPGDAASGGRVLAHKPAAPPVPTPPPTAAGSAGLREPTAEVRREAEDRPRAARPEQKLNVIVHNQAPVPLQEQLGGAVPPAAAPPPVPAAQTMRARRAPAAPAVAPEVTAAMQVPVRLEVSNVALPELAERLSASAKVSIRVESPALREVQVSAELKEVPLYQALETVAARANLVIEPRGRSVALVSAAEQGVSSQDDGQRSQALSVWSPAWGGLPARGFAVRKAGERPAVKSVCPHCRRAVPAAASLACPTCRRPVKPSATRCLHCGAAAPARCPECRRPLGVKAK